MAHPNEVQEIVRAELKDFSDGLQSRLEVAFRKALDTVTTEFEDRLQALEEDQARLLRHTGLD